MTLLGRPPIVVGGVRLDNLTQSEVVDHVLSELRAGRGGVIVTPNLDHLAMIRSGHYDGALVDKADLVVADGMPLIWASWIAGRRLPERVAGSDLFPRLCEAAAAAGVNVAFVGGRPGAGEEAAKRLATRFDSLRVVATPCPPLGFEQSEAGLQEILDGLVATGAEIAFIALGAPKQEEVSTWLHDRLPGVWFLGCGGALDMQAGYVQRAPRWVQKVGAEWLWRLALEPRRLASRYLGRDLPYAARLVVESLHTRLTGWRERRSSGGNIQGGDPKTV